MREAKMIQDQFENELKEQKDIIEMRKKEEQELQICKICMDEFGPEN